MQSGLLGKPAAARVGAASVAHDIRSPPDLFVEPLQHVGAFEMLMVLARQAIEGQRLLDGLLDPDDELLVAGAPLGDPG